MATERPLEVSFINREITGEFVELYGERYYAIHDMDRMPAFFVNVVSHDNHWLFASSNGGLTAGRVSPEFALFPYVTVDKIHDSAGDTGCLTLIRVSRSGETLEWQPFAPFRHPDSPIQRTLYKSVAGNTLCFEEQHLELGLTFRYRWRFSSTHGFVRDCEIHNNTDRHYEIDMIDGLRNLLPAGTPRFTQTNSSNLVDAYKWSELFADAALGCFNLYSAITDRAEPAESLRANTVYLRGLSGAQLLLSDRQIDAFRAGLPLTSESRVRGQRGSFLACTHFSLGPRGQQSWRFVAEIEQDQAAVSQLRQTLLTNASLDQNIDADIEAGTNALVSLMASSDGLQDTAEESVSVHHYANVLFNVLRGGIVDANYDIRLKDFIHTLGLFDCGLAARHETWLQTLPDTMRREQLLDAVAGRGDLQLERLCREYLPIRFGRRHGDPSRPWNQFAIELYGDEGERLLAYQGNWRDIFQNWEALALSYPDFVENMIAKFVNASTADGYNPYRITSEGIDWEVEEPDNPWSYIGYWGDHQIIYLQKLLELSAQFHPERLSSMLDREVFCYANVPYRLRSFAQTVADPKNTVDFDETLAEDIDRRVAARGADGKLILDGDGSVYRVNLVEKLLVPVLTKLSNLVLDGGIWMNTQRPEWNDANNALVGQGVSMVTANYLRRHLVFLSGLFPTDGNYPISNEISDWLDETCDALNNTVAPLMPGVPVSDAQRWQTLEELGLPACRYRAEVYRQEGFSGKRSVHASQIHALLRDALIAIEHCVSTSKRHDSMFNAYSSLEIRDGELGVHHLYPMLEGQVAALSSGKITADESIDMLDALFASSMYRDDQNTFMLYPDRDLPLFLDRNRLDESTTRSIGLLQQLITADDERLVLADPNGGFRFNADLFNASELESRLSELAGEYPDAVAQDRDAIHGLYEKTFNHQSFTGRSGTMFGFEGLGSIYWHMVAKLLLAVQESYIAARDNGADAAKLDALAKHYYKVRFGFGFNKTPSEYGAFPYDPYSHTPGHAGAQQPGMTGQVKEEILSRFGELGLRLQDGALTIQPTLLRSIEFAAESRTYRYLDVNSNWRTLPLPPNSLAFTWCQVPFVYTLDAEAPQTMTLHSNDGSTSTIDGLALPLEMTRRITSRADEVTNVAVVIDPNILCNVQE